MQSPSIMNHISIGTDNLERALAFYDAVLAPLDAKRQFEVPNIAIAYGKNFPEFWVQLPYNREPAQTANGVHFAFNAESQAAVDAFYQAALNAGARDDGEPGPREMYGPAYYGCFVRDLDGHKIEACYIDETKL